MSQKLSPFLESKYGWNFGESGWNSGMDENLLKFSFMLDRNVDSVTAELPSPINGQAHYLTVDNRIYFAVGSNYFSTPVPKWFTVINRSDGSIWQFDGQSLVSIETSQELSFRISSTEGTLSQLGTAAYESVESFATQSALDLVVAQTQAYVDDAVVGKVTQVSGVSDLRNLEPAFDGQQCELLGHSIAGVGGGTFYADFSSSAADDNGVTIVTSGGKRWVRRLDGFVTPYMFGAVGDGVADDSAPFQSAIMASERIYIPTGTFKVTSTTVPAGKYIYGDGLDKSVLLSETPVSNYAVLRIDGGGVCVTDLCIKTVNVNTTTVLTRMDIGASIRVDSLLSDVTISRCRLSGFNTSVLLNSRNSRIVVENCVIENMFMSTTDVSSGYGVVLQSAYDCLVKNNYFANTVNRHGVYVSVANGFIGYRNSVVGNTFIGRNNAETNITGYEYPVKVMSNIDCIVSENIFDGGCGAIMLSTFDDGTYPVIKNTIVSNNIISNLVSQRSDGAAIGVFPRGAAFKSMNIFVTGNSVKNCASHFISLTDFDGLKVSGNDVELVDNSTFENYGFYSFGLGDSNSITIENNEFAVEHRLLRFTSMAQNSTISDVVINNNRVYLAGTYAVEIVGATVALAGFSINNNLFRGAISRLAQLDLLSLDGQFNGNLSYGNTGIGLWAKAVNASTVQFNANRGSTFFNGGNVTAS